MMPTLRAAVLGLRLAIAASLTTFATAEQARTTARDGTLLSSAPCPPNPVRDHAAHMKAERAFLDEERDLGREEGKPVPAVTDEQLRAALATPAEVADHVAYAGFECRAIAYASGGLKIAGFLWKPIDTAGRRLPLLIVNRGGNGDFGAMEPWRGWGWHDFLKAGYVVLASQYRGGPGSDGADEFGGRDVDDVAALIPLARSLGYVDTGRVFVFGGSRGGMESFMLARRGVGVRAVAIRAGLADVAKAAATRPAFERVLALRIPDYATDRDAALERRSAVRWASDLKAPMILFHGTADWRVLPQGSLDLAAALLRAGRPVEFHLYAGDDHAITLNQRDMHRRIIRFFAAAGGPAPALPD